MESARMEWVQEPARRLAVLAEADVVVAGGGPGGWPAAVAAARSGARTVLLERYGFLGGMATAGLIGPILGHTAHKSTTPIIGGLARELCDRLHARGAAPAWDDALEMWGIPFEPELMKVVLDEMVCDAGVDVLLHTLVCDALVRDGRIEALVVEGKSGRHAVRGRLFVDATGDADVAFRAGVPTHMGRPADGRPMAMGTMFRVGGVGQLSQQERAAGEALVLQARDRGELNVYNAGLQTRSSTLRPDHITPNVTRFAGDPTDVRDLTRGEMALRRDTVRMLEFCRRHIGGFRRAFLAAFPAQIGIRESRQIQGLYTLTGEDIVEGRRFADVVALGSWWIDIHCPLGRVRGGVHLCTPECPAEPPCHMLTEHAAELPERLHPPDGGWYEIPYRCLVPRGVENLLVSGRCISATHEGVAGARVMGTCMAVGQAAGCAAALCVRDGVQPCAVSVPELQRVLEAQGAVLRPT